MLSRLELADSFASMLSETRKISDKTQREMAKAMGKSVGTIQNWEAGISTPDVIDLIEWFHVVGLNPMHYINKALHPEYNDPDNDAKRERMIKYVRTEMSPWAVQLMYFNVLGAHGSSVVQQLNMLAMNNLTNMENKARVARVILDNYRYAEMTGQLTSEGQVQVDSDALRESLAAGIDAAASGKTGYVGFTG